MEIVIQLSFPCGESFTLVANFVHYLFSRRFSGM